MYYINVAFLFIISLYKHLCEIYSPDFCLFSISHLHKLGEVNEAAVVHVGEPKNRLAERR